MLTYCSAVKNKSLALMLLGLISSSASAWTGDAIHGRGNVHHHPGYNRPYYHGGYDRYYSWPQFNIQIPMQRYYRPRCDEIEVCNTYGECWLEESCG